MKTENLTIEIKCNNADKARKELSKIRFNLFLMRIGIMEKETPDEKFRRKRKLELIRKYKESVIRQNQQINNLRNSKNMNEFQKAFEELMKQ